MATFTTTIPSMMKAAQQSDYGEARQVLTLPADVEVPRELSPHQVLVRVYSASINPIDWKLLNGNLKLLSRYTFPHTPGCDVAGVVVDVGSAVTRFQIGEKVYGNVGMAGGSFAEYVRGDESMFSLKPKNVPMHVAAAIPLACETSYQALFKKVSPPVSGGCKVFICGGSSATGLYAIQLANSIGAQVATTCSKRNFDLFEKIGCKFTERKEDLNNAPGQILVIDYNTKDFGQELKGEDYDVVFDCVGGEKQWTSAQQILRQGGQFITIVGDDTKTDFSLKTVATVGAGLINRKFWSVFSTDHHGYIMHVLNHTPEDLDDIRVNYIDTGKVQVLIDTVYDWQRDGVEALHALYDKSKSGKARGKLVLTIANEQ